MGDERIPAAAGSVEQALALHGQGDLGPAAAAYEGIFAADPRNFPALHGLGLLRLQAGAGTEAVRLLQAALRVNPRSAQAHFNLGNALWTLQRPEEALAHLRMALAYQPGHPEALLHRSLILAQLARPEEALASLEPFLALQPEHRESLLQRGALLLELGRPGDARAALDRLLALDPDRAEALINRATTFQQDHRLPEALADLDRALQLSPGNPDALLNRGLVLLESRHFAESLACFEPVLAQAPLQPAALLGQARALLDLGRLQEALTAYDRILALPLDSPDLHINRANTLMGLGRVWEALAGYDRALVLRPDDADTHLNRANALHRLGRHPEAIAAFDRTLALQPCYPQAHSSKIFALDYLPDPDFRDLQRERADYFLAQAPGLPPSPGAHGNDRNPDRRLVVGYVSADFKCHSAASGFRPVLLHHDRSAFKLVGYSGVLEEDPWTREFRDHMDAWRCVQNLSDDALADLIREDGIDILVDLSGHSLGNRLLTFARRPAPIQITAWGHGGGTGLPMMDYQFTDPINVPAWARPLYAETSIDLPCLITYEAPDYAPPVGTLPAQARGAITFGSLNRFLKHSPETLALWARILERVPGSRLLLKDHLLEDPQVQARLRADFAGHGIGPERLELRGSTPHRDHLATYGEVDIALDPFPQNGGISTWEALWMGSPVLALLGNKPAGRISAAILAALGLEAWVAESPDGYLERAVAMAGDLPALARFRTASRARILASPAGNPERYTRAVETAYRTMWKQWTSR